MICAKRGMHVNGEAIEINELLLFIKKLSYDEKKWIIIPIK